MLQHIQVDGNLTYKAPYACIVRAQGGAKIPGSSVVFLKQGDSVTVSGKGVLLVSGSGMEDVSGAARGREALSSTHEFTALVVQGLRERLRGAMSTNQSLDGLVVDLTLLEVDMNRMVATLLDH